MNSFARRLQWLLALVLILNSLVIALHGFSAWRALGQARQSLIETGETITRSFAGGQRFFMRRTGFTPEEAEQFLQEFFQQQAVENFVLYDGDGRIILALHPEQPVALDTAVDTRRVLETDEALILYKPFTPHLPSGMMGRGRGMMESPFWDRPLFTALVLDKEPLRALLRRTWLELAQVSVIQLLLVAAYLYALRFIRFHLATEEKLQAAERNAEVGRFAGVLAHEIKNPLSAMGGLLDYAADKQSEEQVRDVIGRARDEVRRLDGIVNGFLAYGKETVLEKTDCDLRALVERAAELLRYEFDGKGLRLNVTGPSLNVYADGDKLLQVLFNLLLNAVQAAPDQSAIQARLDGEKRSLRVENAVTAPVEGDPEELFRPFVTSRAQGSGLGLPIARKILELHGFSIGIEKIEPFVVVVRF
ncbi:ATP-binding protein [Geoalkalibacter halelectricus]|uniref:histidine kinase n=1 Tax=Geoalkalibacter halelectricus TaxID=2847045 RepID=A0ABY5ZJM0_9BACT|nr:ATP-binding protein [Geoalkalibacter halelectricus]MDO3378903.1 ATP-binding protein [Geoalkalibacter halelectricus]UWZ79074.1 ATP-binding protein [Geoalkalibacter halelectricus]